MRQAQVKDADGVRLSTWKAISEFLGKDERTAKRWERTRGMPVHRVPGGGSGTVHAYVDELKRWRDGALRTDAEPSLDADTLADGRKSGSIDHVQSRMPVRRFGVMAVAIGAVAVIGSAATGLRAIEPPPSTHVAGSAPTRAPNAAAVDLYRLGRYEWNRRTPQSLRAALADFTQAAVIDPEYADAYAGLADTYNLMREYGSMSDGQAYPAAAQAAEHALSLNNGLAEAHAALAFVEFHWSWDVKGARREFERAITLDPRSANAQQWYATALLELGAFDEALRHIDQAEAIAPESASIRADKGLILLNSGRSEEAEAIFRQLAAANPRFLSPHDYLADLYFQQRRYPEYLRELHAVAALKGDEATRRLAAASEQAYRSGGEAAMLRAKINTEQTLYAEGLVSDYQLAYAYAQNHDASQAIHYLAAAIVRHSPGALDALGAPEFRFIRGRADYQRLCARLNAVAAEFSPA